MNYKIIIRFSILLILSIACYQLDAQCAMCKQIVNSGTQNGSNIAKGLNMGILYLLGVPFLAVSTVAFSFWRRWKATQK